MPIPDNVILSTAYLAPVQYFSKLASYRNVLIEQHENYSKQTYRNRCIIYSANGKLILSIPVVKKSNYKLKITDVKIDYSTNWQKIHWKAIESGYKSSPYYEFYIDELAHFYEKKYSYLIDYNTKIQETMISCLSLNCNYFFTNSYIKEYPENFIDMRDKIHPKESKNKKDKDFISCTYNQVFIEKYGFMPNLSIIDLLFNEGPNASGILCINSKTQKSTNSES